MDAVVMFAPAGTQMSPTFRTSASFCGLAVLAAPFCDDWHFHVQKSSLLCARSRNASAEACCLSTTVNSSHVARQK